MKNKVSKSIDIIGLLLWFAGFIMYRMSLGINTILGSSVPVIIIIVVLASVVRKIECRMINKGEYQYGENN